MKNSIITAAVILTFASCNEKINTSEKKQAVPASSETKKKEPSTIPEVVYTCPMHPEVTGKKGEKCPKCEMDLVAKQ